MNNREIQIIHAASKHGDRPGLPMSSWMLGSTAVGLANSPYKLLPGLYCANDCIVSFFGNRFFASCPKDILEDATVKAETNPVIFEPNWGWAVRVFMLHVTILLVIEYNLVAGDSRDGQWGSIMGITCGLMSFIFLIFMSVSQFLEANVFGEGQQSRLPGKADAFYTERTPLLDEESANGR